VFNSSLFNEFVCKLGFFGTTHEWAKRESNKRFKGPRVPKRPNLDTNELNTTFFCSTNPLKAPNRLKSLKLVVTFIKIRSHRRKFLNSDSVKEKRYLKKPKIVFFVNNCLECKDFFIITKQQ
jgi:hypothetical protein